MSSGGARGDFFSFPLFGESKRVPGQVTQSPSVGYLGASGVASVVEREERLLARSDPRIRVIVVFFDVLFKHAVIGEILLKQ